MLLVATVIPAVASCHRCSAVTNINHMGFGIYGVKVQCGDAPTMESRSCPSLEAGRVSLMPVEF